MGKMAWSDESKAAPLKARIPLGKFAEPENVAKTVAFLLSEHSDMVHGSMV
jgi:NAD(P)-dependent dehydrogenase (short-subunit alcohol dehydrogenase family)